MKKTPFGVSYAPVETDDVWGYGETQDMVTSKESAYLSRSIRASILTPLAGLGKG